MERIAGPHAWIALATLTVLEIVLGIDNFIFVSILAGFTLLGEGFGFYIPKGYIYFAMAFSITVELLNLKVKAKRQKTIRLNPKNDQKDRGK